VHAGRPITPAAEWLLDNYHVIEEQIREIRVDLPPGFYRELPKFADGHFAGYPRVFSVAWAYVAHTDSRFDPETLRRFVHAYQSVQPLTIGELWAVAITLRVVLVENMRRAAQRIVSSRIARQEADAIADRLLGVNGQLADPDALVRAHGDASVVPAAFVVQLTQRLRDQDPTLTPALVWLEKHLSERHTTADQVVHEEHQRQGASNVTVRNIITSMRLISDVDWAEFFESVSLVDEALRSGSDFAQIGFCHPQSVPRCDREARAQLEAHRGADRPGGGRGHAAAGRKRRGAGARSGLSPDRRRAPRLRGGRRLPPTDLGARRTVQYHDRRA
jgi:cyclic beta-1,2-glucan synthetase